MTILPKWPLRRRRDIVVHIATPMDAQSAERIGKAIADALRKYDGRAAQ